MLVESFLLGAGYLALLSHFRKEYKDHRERVQKIPIRIHVNGIRGKSSVTRMVGSVMHEAGYKTFTKTTGSAAKLIDHKKKERDLKRRVPNIIEQVHVIKNISKHNPDAAVMECMAVTPFLQKVSEEKMINATVGILTNVREDHQDRMGWTLQEITNSLCEFMPSDATLICSEQRPDLVKIIKKRAKEKNTKVVVVNNGVSKEDLKVLNKLPYIEHEENISTVFALARHFGINRKTTIEGILNTIPDPGVLKIHRKKKNGKHLHFINAHAINDKHSIIKVYDMLKRRGFLDKQNIAVLYHRKDRPERVEMFSDIVSKDLSFDNAILLGHYKQRAKRRLVENGFPIHRIHSLKKESLPELLALFERLTEKESNIIGMVNIHGPIVEKYIEHFRKAEDGGVVFAT